MTDNTAAHIKRLRIEAIRQTDLLYRIWALLALANVLIGFAFLYVIFFGVPSS